MKQVSPTHPMEPNLQPKPKPLNDTMKSPRTRFQGSSAELGTLLKLALPITFGQLAQTANGFIDTIMAGDVSALDLAAAALGSSMWVPVYLFISGILIATTATTAALFGAQAYSQIPTAVHQALWLALGLGAFSFCLVLLSPTLFELMKVEQDLQELAKLYLLGVAWGMPGICLFVAMRAFSDAISHTKPMMVISVLGLLINIPLNYILIHGKLGLPAMGGAGCGWATGIVMWLMAIMMAIHVHVSPRFKRFRVFQSFSPPDLTSIASTFKLGLPIGLSIFFEISIFSLIALFLSSLGAITIAAHQVALNFASLMFMLPLSLAMALTIRVGQFAGQKDYLSTRFTCICGLCLTVCVAIGTSIVLIFGRDQIGLIYSDDPAVLELAGVLIMYAALFQISDGLQVAANGALRGFKDTTKPMLLTLVAYWGAGLPMGYTLGATTIWGPPLGAPGYWMGLVIGLTVAALLLNGRLYLVLKSKKNDQLWQASAMS